MEQPAEVDKRGSIFQFFIQLPSPSSLLAVFLNLSLQFPQKGYFGQDQLSPGETKVYSSFLVRTLIPGESFNFLVFGFWFFSHCYYTKPQPKRRN